MIDVESRCTTGHNQRAGQSWGKTETRRPVGDTARPLTADECLGDDAAHSRLAFFSGCRGTHKVSLPFQETSGVPALAG